MPVDNFNIKGLTDEQVLESRKKYGYNRLEYKKENGFIDALKSLVKEPMVLLLFVAASIYFVSGLATVGETMVIVLEIDHLLNSEDMAVVESVDGKGA